MIIVLIVSAVTLVSLPGLLVAWGRRIHPADWSRWCVWSLVGGALAVQAALVLITAPTVLDAAGFHGLADICARMSSAVPLAGPWVGWLAGAASVLGPFVATRTARATRRANDEVATAAVLAPMRRIAGMETRVLGLHQPLAASVAGGCGIVIVSEGLIGALSESEMVAVVRHEQAHLLLGHHRYLLCAAWIDSVLGCFTPARRSTDVLRTAVERWADEHAAGASSVDRSDMRDALLAVVGARTPKGIAAFSSARTVFERVTALEQPAPTRDRRWVAGLPIVGAGGVGVMAGSVALAHLGIAVVMFFSCPVLRS